jgi:hypothetical protein
MKIQITNGYIETGTPDAGITEISNRLSDIAKNKIIKSSEQVISDIEAADHRAHKSITDAKESALKELTSYESKILDRIKQAVITEAKNIEDETARSIGNLHDNAITSINKKVDEIISRRVRPLEEAKPKLVKTMGNREHFMEGQPIESVEDVETLKKTGDPSNII